MKSMTGFGRASLESNGKNYIIEIKTVNNKYSDITVKSPKRLSFMEDKIRKQIANRITRGKVEVSIQLNNNSDLGKKINLNTDIAKKISKPNEKHHVIITDDENEFEIYSYGITKDIYKEYTETLKANGFIQDEDYSSYYEGKDKDGYEVTVWFNNIEESLSIRIEKE